MNMINNEEMRIGPRNIWAVVVHTFNPSTQEAEPGGSL